MLTPQEIIKEGQKQSDILAIETLIDILERRTLNVTALLSDALHTVRILRAGGTGGDTRDILKTLKETLGKPC